MGSRYDRLTTEQVHRKTTHLDRLDSLGVVRIMARRDRVLPGRVARAEQALARTADEMADALAAGGRIFFIGAGTSGRLGVLEAAECPPTFGTRPFQVQAIIAGGARAVRRPQEGAEDDTEKAVSEMSRRRVGKRDTVVGISAGGLTPFVRSALCEAALRSARTSLLTCNPIGGLPKRIRPILLDVGPEVLAGSTRLGAGTACKLALNMMTTAAMVRLGKVCENIMVEVKPSSQKLRERALRIVMQLAPCNRRRARGLLQKCDWSPKLAVAAAWLRAPADEARRALRRAGGSLRHLRKDT